jgi:SAM-dependent methyltransferase
MDIREKMRRDWDRRARIDPRYWVAATQDATVESYEASGDRDAAAMVEGLRGRVGPDARVLDLGCGMGRLTARAAERFAHVDGVDVSPEMIEVARKEHAGRANVAFHVNSGADLAGFPDASFDLVFSYAVLSHVPAEVVRAYFREVNRVLRPGGWFRYQFWVGRDQLAGSSDTISIRVYSPETFQQLNRDAGFSLHELDEIDYEDPILQLKPVWVNAQKVGEPAAATHGPRDPADADDASGRTLEYDLLLYLAIQHAERGETAEAERVLEEAVGVDPKRPEAYIQWAAHRLDRDDVKGARTLFAACTDAAPTCAPAWLYRAQMCALLDDFAGANEALKALAGLAEVDPEVRREAAALRRRLNRPRRR